MPVHNFYWENLQEEGRRRAAKEDEEEEEDGGLVGEWSMDRAKKVGRLLKGGGEGRGAGDGSDAGGAPQGQAAGQGSDGASGGAAGAQGRPMATKIEDQTYTAEVPLRRCAGPEPCLLPHDIPPALFFPHFSFFL